MPAVCGTDFRADQVQGSRRGKGPLQPTAFFNRRSYPWAGPFWASGFPGAPGIFRESEGGVEARFCKKPFVQGLSRLGLGILQKSVADLKLNAGDPGQLHVELRGGVNSKLNFF